MRRILQSLLVAAVLMCGLHIGEPAHAHDDIEQHQSITDSGNDADDNGDAGRMDPANFGKAGHSHCPLTPDQNSATLTSETALVAGIIFARPVAALHSLSQAPPIEPPAT